MAKPVSMVSILRFEAKSFRLRVRSVTAWMNILCGVMLKTCEISLNNVTVQRRKHDILYTLLVSHGSERSHNEWWSYDTVYSGRLKWILRRILLRWCLVSTLVRPVVTYGSESWTLTMEEERALAVFERKILRKIYGPVKENDLWRIRRNDELEAIIKGENIVRFIK